MIDMGDSCRSRRWPRFRTIRGGQKAQGLVALYFDQSRTIPAMPGRRRQRDRSALKATRLRLAPQLTR